MKKVKNSIVFAAIKVGFQPTVTQSELVDWLRKTHGIIVWVQPSGISKDVFYPKVDADTEKFTMKTFNIPQKDSWENAIEAGIKKALELLKSNEPIGFEFDDFLARLRERNLTFTDGVSDNLIVVTDFNDSIVLYTEVIEGVQENHFESPMSLFLRLKSLGWI